MNTILFSRNFSLLWAVVIFALTSSPRMVWAQDADIAEIYRRLLAAEEEVRQLRKELNEVRTQKQDGQPPVTGAVSAETLQRGRVSFNQHCTSCHEASRSLDKEKDFAQWQRVIKRMARKPRAKIPAEEFDPIAHYLASLHQPEPVAATEQEPVPLPLKTDPPETSIEQFAETFNFNMTLSTVFFFFIDGNDDLENNGFFPEIWFGGEWHAPKSPVRVRATACITCHTEGSTGNRLELVEGVAILDLLHEAEDLESIEQAEVQAGRFIVPFGGFAQQSHPGSFRTVTKPLLYNMGQSVNRDDIGSAVLPMPYSDEGIMTTLRVPVAQDVSASLEAFLVNGLQGDTNGVNFFDSRDYVDNNSEPAYGGRITVGNSNVTVGGSYMNGQFNETGGGGILDQELDYEIYGADVTVRHEDLWRVQFEYAMRRSDRVFFPQSVVEEEEVKGYNVEGELRVVESPRISVIGRYDLIERSSDAPPPGSSLTESDFTVDRATWGFNFSLPGGSTLMLNHEHWFMPEALDDVDVIGGRWVVPF